jgi:hypothetical protein
VLAGGLCEHPRKIPIGVHAAIERDGLVEIFGGEGRRRLAIVGWL